MRFPSEGGPYDGAVIVFAFVTLYAACAALLVAAVWQDRSRAATRRAARDPRATHATEFVFRTQA